MAEHGNVKYAFAAPGSLSANWTITWELDHAFMPRHVAFNGSNASDALISLGTAAATTAVLDTKDAGDSDAVAEYDKDNFEDADYQFSKGDIVQITIDYDGAAGTAIDDPCIVISGLVGA